MSLKKLKPEVLGLLTSHSSIVTIGSAVRELIQNSVDANCSAIEVYLDLKRWRIVVRDDGDGITRSELDMLGEEYLTSKITIPEELNSCQTFGYRGQAIHMLEKVCKLTLVSRSRNSESICIRKFPLESQLAYPGTMPKQYLPLGRTGGTAAVLDDIFYNLPVRRGLIERSPEYKIQEELRACVLEILVFRPTLEVSVFSFNDGTSKSIVTSKNIRPEICLSQRLTLVFTNIFGNFCSPDSFQFVSATYLSYKIDGIISVRPASTNSYQYIYINNRKYENNRFYNTLNALFRSAYQVGYQELTESAKVVSQLQNPKPVYLLRCFSPLPVTSVAQKTLTGGIQEEPIDIINCLILRLVKAFLKCEGYASIMPKLGRVQQQKSEEVQMLAKVLPEPDIMLNTTVEALPHGGRITSMPNGNSFKSNTTRYPKRIKTKTSCLIGKVGKKKECDMCSNPKVHDNNRANAWKSKNLSCRGELHSDLVAKSTSYSLGFSFCTDYKISQSQLQDCVVINQVDRKFILLKLLPSKFNPNPLLLILDQHAADERIKLELYISEFFSDLLFPFDNDRFPEYEVRLDVTEAEAQILSYFKEEFEFWGIRFNVVECDGTCTVFIKSFPDIMSGKVKDNGTFLKQALLQYAYDLESHRSLRATSINFNLSDIRTADRFQWWKYTNAMPKTLLSLFCRKACRSAIMFGHKLRYEECTSIIDRLSKCALPFQCAHGRPSIIPILELQSDTTSRFGMRHDDYIID